MSSRLLVLALLLLPLVAQAQFAEAPFRDEPLALSHAFATELIIIRLQALSALEALGPLDEEFVEEVGEAVEEDLPRFSGSLAVQDSELLEQLEEALEEALAAAAANASTEASAARAQELTRQAQRALIPSELWERPSFRAGLIAQLMLNEGGVAEGYEEAAAGEVWEYPSGWAALQRVRELWADLVPLASEDQRFEVEDMLSALDELYPAPAAPEGIANSDPEEAEAPSHRIVGFLEEITQTSLYPGRDPGELYALTGDLVRMGCEARGADQGALATEPLIIARAYYEEDLGDTLALFSPDLHATILELFDGLADGDGAEACDDLQERLEEARALLGA